MAGRGVLTRPSTEAEGREGLAGTRSEPRSPDSTAAAESRTDTTVLIIDDHRSFADLLAAALDTVEGIRCVGTATTCEEGLRRAAELSPTVVVVDLQMPGTDGLETTRRLRAASPDTAVAVVTGHVDPEWVNRAAQAGASAFVAKGGSLSELIEMLRSARPGRMSLAPSLRGTVVSYRPSRELIPELTARELEVLGHIAQGLQVKGIARLMGISVHTCRGYIKALYAKLGVGSRIEAVNEARRLQLVAS